MSKENNSDIMITGVIISNVLGFIFIVLKLTGIIDWSWWCVVLPYLVWAVPLCLSVLILYVVDLLSKRVYDTEEIENNGF